MVNKTQQRKVEDLLNEGFTLWTGGKAAATWTITSGKEAATGTIYNVRQFAAEKFTDIADGKRYDIEHFKVRVRMTNANADWYLIPAVVATDEDELPVVVEADATAYNGANSLEPKALIGAGITGRCEIALGKPIFPRNLGSTGWVVEHEFDATTLLRKILGWMARPENQQIAEWHEYKLVLFLANPGGAAQSISWTYYSYLLYREREGRVSGLLKV